MADGSVKIDITADDSDLKGKLSGIEGEAESAAGGLDDLSGSAEDVGKDFGTAEIAVGTFVGNALTSLGSKLVDTVKNISALAEETREYRDDMAKLDSAFTTAGHSTETAQSAYDSFYKILGESDRTVEAVNHLAEFTKSEEELSQWSTICAGVTARFGDSLPIEGLTEAANETAKVGQVTGPLADALNWAGISEDEFNKKLAECTTEQERASLITSTLNGEYSAAAEEYNKLTANTQAARDATNNMEQAQAALGAAIEPVTTAWTNMKANALQWFVDNGIPALQTGFQWVLDNLPAIATIVGGLAAAFLIYNSATIASTASTWAAQAAQVALNIAQNMSPLGWIVLSITAVVGAFLLLWENCEGFRNFWIGLWENVKTVLSPVVEWLKQAFTQAWDGIKFVWDLVQPYFALLWENIKIVFSVVAEWFGGMFSTAWEAIKAVWNVVGAYFSATWETIKGIFAVVGAVLSGNWSDAWEAIKGIVSAWGAYFQTIWDGIKAVFGSVKEWFGSTFQTAWDGIKQIWGNVTAFFTGIWDGIKGGASTAWEGIKSVFSNVTTFFGSVFSTAWEKVKEVFSTGGKIFDGIKDGIVSSFKTVVNAIIRGINKVVKTPFEGINGVLNKIQNLSIAGVKPFNWLSWRAPIPQIPELERGGVLRRGQVGLLEGNGAEAVVPLEKNAAWIKKTAEDLKRQLQNEGILKLKSAVHAENARMMQGVGVRDTGFTDIAQAVGMQTAGINSLASEYRKGSSANVTVPLVLNGRELGRAFIDLGKTEDTRTGSKTSLVFA